MATCSNCKLERELPDGRSCEECLIYLQDIQKDVDSSDDYVIVSKEMAIDAGDRRLEGQLWKW